MSLLYFIFVTGVDIIKQRDGTFIIESGIFLQNTFSDNGLLIY